MEFRPCIDIHNGKVKQIVGSSLKDRDNAAIDNFVAQEGGDYFANLYKNAGIKGGHIILLNPVGSEYYEADCEQAFLALKAYPQGLQIGGGITALNAKRFLDAGASHVIVTSYVFQNGKIQYDRLNELKDTVGKERLVLDMSCKRVGDAYYVVTDRWQKLTNEKMDISLLNKLEQYCDEFLIHAVDVEGQCHGIEETLIEQIGDYVGNPITYAGGVRSYEDVWLLKRIGQGRMNVTVGSALDLFGGPLKYMEIHKICKE